MKDRIFPTVEQQGGIASEKEFTGINWEKFAEKYPDMVKEANAAPSVPDNLKEILESGISDDTLRTAEEKEEGPEEEESCDDVQKGMKHEDVPVKPKKLRESDEDLPVTPKKLKESDMVKRARSHKIRFSKAEQISAEAIEDAKKTGSDELVNTILAARKQRRIHLANKIVEAATKIEADAETNDEDLANRLAKRDEYRKKVASNIESGLKKTAGKSKIKITVADGKTGFKKVAEFGDADKQAFAQVALSKGFPEEYVKHMLGTVEPEVVESNIEDQFKEIMASTFPVTTKKAALEGMMRTAELDEAQKKRLVDYWIKDLQYGDEEWVKNWINKTYN